MQENNFNAIIQTALESVKEIADGNTVLGDPIETTGGIVIIPISRIGVGLAISGLEYAPKKEKTDTKNFGGGGGTGITVTPVAFLIVHPEGRVEVLDMKKAGNQDIYGAINTIVDNGPKLFDKLKATFEKYFKTSKSDDKEAPVKTKE